MGGDDPLAERLMSPVNLHTRAKVHRYGGGPMDTWLALQAADAITSPEAKFSLPPWEDEEEDTEDAELQQKFGMTQAEVQERLAALRSNLSGSKPRCVAGESSQAAAANATSTPTGGSKDASPSPEVERNENRRGSIRGVKAIRSSLTGPQGAQRGLLTQLKDERPRRRGSVLKLDAYTLTSGPPGADAGSNDQSKHQPQHRYSQADIRQMERRGSIAKRKAEVLKGNLKFRTPVEDKILVPPAPEAFPHLLAKLHRTTVKTATSPTQSGDAKSWRLRPLLTKTSEIRDAQSGFRPYGTVQTRIFKPGDHVPTPFATGEAAAVPPSLRDGSSSSSVPKLPLSPSSRPRTRQPSPGFVSAYDTPGMPAAWSHWQQQQSSMWDGQYDGHYAYDQYHGGFGEYPYDAGYGGSYGDGTFGAYHSDSYAGPSSTNMVHDGSSYSYAVDPSQWQGYDEYYSGGYYYGEEQ